MNIQPGTIVDILPAKDGSNFAKPNGWELVGPTRHAYNVVVREPDHGTTVHVNINRVIESKRISERTWPERASMPIPLVGDEVLITPSTWGALTVKGIIQSIDLVEDGLTVTLDNGFKYDAFDIIAVR